MCILDRAFAVVIYDSESAFRASKRVWYMYLLDCRVTKGSGEPVQPCEYSPKPYLAARINDTHTANRACTWDSDTVTKAQASLCTCADSPEPSLLEHRFPFEPPHDILEL